MIDSLFPNALVIGANKSGTSTLCSILDGHPDVCMSSPKEPCTFSDSSKVGQLDTEYEAIFRRATAGQYRIEGSTTYSRWPYAPTPWHPTLQDPWPMITQKCPRVKILYIVRHPVERMISQVKHRFRDGSFRGWTFEAMLEHSDTYVNESRYQTQMEWVRKFVPEDRWFVETFERFNSQRHEVMGEILDFLDLAHSIPDSAMDLHENRAGISTILSSHLNSIRGSKTLKKVVPLTIRRQLKNAIERSPIGTSLQRRISLEPMKAETRSRLLEVLETDTQMIESIIGRDLPEWRV